MHTPRYTSCWRQSKSHTLPLPMKARAYENWFAIEKLTENVFGIGEFGHFEEVISYLVIGDNASVLIDSGMGFYSLKKAIEKLVVGPCSVINTHSHFDHIGSNHEFAEVSLYDHPTNRKHAREGISAEKISQWFKDDQFWEQRPRNLPEHYAIQAFPQATFFNDGETLFFGSLQFTVLHTPGHSDDSVCFYQPDTGFLFAGDLLYNGPIFIDEGDGLEKYRRSINRIRSIDGLKMIFPAHNSFEFTLEMLDALGRKLDQIQCSTFKSEVAIQGRFRLVPS